MRMYHILIYDDDGIKNPLNRLNNIEDVTSRQLLESFLTIGQHYNFTALKVLT